MPKIKKSKVAKERRKYCHCTTICTAKINRQNRLRHYRRANIPLNEAPPSVAASESGEERSKEEKSSPIAISVRNLSAGDQWMNSDGHLGSGSDSEDQVNGSGQDTVHNWEGNGPGHRYGELRMDVDEESDRGAMLGDSESEREEYDNRGLEFDEWKEFDEAAEADLLGDSESEREEFDTGNRGSEFDEWKGFDEAAEAGLLEDLSDSDMLSELDLMLESDDLAADEDEAEGWANRQYLFNDSAAHIVRDYTI
jgi:hypothetical protein